MTVLTTRNKFHISLDEVREILRLSFPEVAQATIREKTEGDVTFYEFLPVAGRKG
jgi:hypothetical protein